MKKIIIITFIILTVLGVGIGLYYYDNGPSATNNKNTPISFSGTEEEIVSPEAVHWHANLAIYINGQKQDIPTNIGVGSQYSSNKFYHSKMGMTDIHTHDSNGELHWEIMQGPTRKGHLRLGNFFEIWGKSFNPQQILSSNSTDKEKVKMKVNGKENTEFENYHIQDKDDIEIRYE